MCTVLRKAQGPVPAQGWIYPRDGRTSATVVVTAHTMPNTVGTARAKMTYATTVSYPARVQPEQPRAGAEPSDAKHQASARSEQF